MIGVKQWLTNTPAHLQGGGGGGGDNPPDPSIHMCGDVHWVPSTEAHCPAAAREVKMIDSSSSWYLELLRIISTCQQWAAGSSRGSFSPGKWSPCSPPTQPLTAVAPLTICTTLQQRSYYYFANDWCWCLCKTNSFESSEISWHEAETKLMTWRRLSSVEPPLTGVQN